MENNFDRQTILNKVWAGSKLTQEEELYYLTEIVGLSKEQAEATLFINANDDETVLID